MFNKKRCPNCNKNVNKKDNFCPICGERLVDTENYGMLGKNDFIRESKSSQFPFFGGLNDRMLNKMLSGAMKMLEKEMEKSMTDSPKTNVKIIVNGKEVKLNPEKKQIKKRKIELPRQNLEGFSKLQREEPKATIKRLGDTILYEIELPNVKSIKDISITQLENSIEIKAKSQKKAYVKIIPITLPIINYEFLKEKLILELSEKS